MGHVSIKDGISNVILLGIVWMDQTRRIVLARHHIIINVQTATAWKHGKGVMVMPIAMIILTSSIVLLAQERFNSSVK